MYDDFGAVKDALTYFVLAEAEVSYVAMAADFLALVEEGAAL